MAVCEFAAPGVKLKSLSAAVSVTPTATAPPNLLMVGKKCEVHPCALLARLKLVDICEVRHHGVQ